MNTKTTNETDLRITLLAKHLECEADEISVSKYDDDTFLYGREEWRILDDSDADKEARESILTSLWAFNTSFLERYIDNDDSEALIESLQAIQEKLCESCNATIKAMLGNRLEEAISDAISEDGRGHFIASYDFEEIELAVNGKVEFYAYRQN